MCSFLRRVAVAAAVKTFFSIILALASVVALAAPAAGTVDESFQVGTGFNNGVYTLAMQPDSRVLAGGVFNQYAGAPAPGLVRLNANGEMDATFSVGTGFDSSVRTAWVLDDGFIIVGGPFRNVNGVARAGLTWLNPDGSVDTSRVADVGSFLEAILPLPGGQILVTGSFNSVSGQPRKWIVRLNRDGSVDPDFNPGENMFFSAGSPLLLPGGQLLLDASWNVVADGRSLLFRLNPDGTPDLSFDKGDILGFVDALGLMADGSYAVWHSGNKLTRLFTNGIVDTVFQPEPTFVTSWILKTLSDGRLLWGGIVQTEQSQRSVLYRLFADGSIDSSFDVNVDSPVRSALELDDGHLLIAGDFLNINGQSRNRIARLHGDDRTAPTVVRVNGRRFGAEERSGIARVPLFRTGTLNTEATVRFETRSGTALAGEDFVESTGTVTFGSGEEVKVIEVALLDDAISEEDETFAVSVSGDTVAAGEAAEVVIISDEGFIELATESQSVSELADRVAVIARRRGGLPYGPTVTMSVSTGTADTSDLAVYSSQVTFLRTAAAASFSVRVYDDPNHEGNEEAVVTIMDPSAGFELVGSRQQQLIVVDNDTPSYAGEGFNQRAILFPALDGSVVASGSFSTVHGFARTGMARLRADGGIDEPLNASPNATHRVLGLLPDGGIMVESGYRVNFSTITNRYARLFANGTRDPAFASNYFRIVSSSGPPAPPTPIVVDANGGLVFGSLSVDSFRRVTEVFRLTSAGLEQRGFAARTFSTENAVNAQLAFQSGGRLLVAGNRIFVPRVPNTFGNYFDSVRRDLLRITAQGAMDLSFEAKFTGTSTSDLVQRLLVTPDDRIIIAGSFSQVDGVSRLGLARLMPTGALDASFVPAFPVVSGNSISSMTLQTDGKLLLAVPEANGVWQLKRVDAAGRIDPTFAANAVANGAITSVAALDDGRIVVSGDFLELANEFRGRLAWLDRDGNLLPDVPLKLSISLRNGATVLTARSRAGGSLSFEESANFTDWNATGAPVSVAPGEFEQVLPPLPAGAIFLRARIDRP